jgi:hypothetical protein
MKESTVSALIVGGLIGGAILINGHFTNSRITENRERIQIMGAETRPMGLRDSGRMGGNREIRIMRSGDGDHVEMEVARGELGGEADFEFDGTIEELRSLDLEGMDEDLREIIENALLSEDSSNGDERVKLQLKR